MARQKITGSTKRPLTQEQKKKKLAAKFKEWESDYTIDYCRSLFMIKQMERGNTKPTMDFYARGFKKYEAYTMAYYQASLNQIPIDMIAEDGEQALYMTFLQKQGLGVQTVNAYLRAYRSFGNFCEEAGYLDRFECPIKEVEPPVKQVYTDVELEKLMVKPKIEDFAEFRTFCIIGLILNTGARSNTILNIRLSDVDIDEGYIAFNTTKAHKVVRLGLDKKYKRDLAEWIDFWRYGKDADEEDYLFCNEYGEQLSRSALTKSVRQYNNKRGVEKTSLHLLRHTFAKKWITSGGDIITLAKVLTHSELEMVKRYSNLYGSDVKKEMEEHSAISQMKTKSGKTLKNRKKKLTD